MPPNPTATGEAAPAGAGASTPDESPPENAVAPAPAPAPEPETTATAPATAPSATDLVGTVLADRYRLVKCIGEGGMGSVYQAEHIAIGRKLAIKVLAPEYTDSPEVVARFLQEARTASMLHHEHIVDITDFGYTKQGLAFLTMEYLEGEDLATMLAREGRQPWTRVRRIMLQICRALDAAHEAGIVHRDMKPDNCFRIKRGGNPDFIKILDFGIAKVIVDGSNPNRSDRPKMATEAGTLLGTPEYMAPEIARDQKPDARVDVYSVGVVMYELLTGSVPFKGHTFMATVAMQMVDEPEAPHLRCPEANIPDVIERVVLKALQKDPADRHQTIRAFADAIIDADKTLRYTQSHPALSWNGDDYAVDVDDQDGGAPDSSPPSTTTTNKSSLIPLHGHAAHATPQPHPHGHTTPRPNEPPARPVEAGTDVSVSQNDVTYDEPSNFSQRANPYRLLAGLLLLVVVGLGGFVYYLLNRGAEGSPEHAAADETEAAVATGTAGAATGDEEPDDKGDKSDKGDKGDKPGDKKDDEKPKHVKDDEPDRPHKKREPDKLVPSTDEERKEFFGAMLSDVKKCAAQRKAGKELVRVTVEVEAGTGKLDANLTSHKGDAGFAECVEKAFEKRRFKRGRQAFTYNGDYQI